MKNFFCIFLTLIITHTLHSQGCSDAGFCTMGAMKPDQPYSKRIRIKLYSIEVSHYYGRSRFGDKAYNYIAEVNAGFNEKTIIQAKLPYVRVEGPLADNEGIGDLTLSLTRNLVTKPNYQLNITVGTKIPTGSVDVVTESGRTLPMYNQTGLGTYDFITGISFITGKWLFATGWQHAFGESESSFTWNSWLGTPKEAETLQYPQSRALKRGEDIMLRVERNFRFLNWNFNVGLLPIYRINEDEVTTGFDSEGNFVGFTTMKVKNSNGLALTLLLGGGYFFDVRNGIKVMNGFRLIRREKNPDGLSREFVSNVGYVFRF